MRQALQDAIREACYHTVYMPVQRQNAHGGQMSPDMMAAIPIPLWERVVEACDQMMEEADDA